MKSNSVLVRSFATRNVYTIDGIFWWDKGISAVMQKLLCLACAAILSACPTFILGATPSLPLVLEFSEAESATENPDRGLFDQIRINNSLSIPSLSEEFTNHRIYFVIDYFVDQPLSDKVLQDLEASIRVVASKRQRLIIRFAYDWSSLDALSARRARTASPSLMSKHIFQLASVIRRNAQAVYAVESGLIGFWGEQHGDTPDKQSPSGIASIVDQWRAALAGTSIQVLVRYPKMLREHVRLHPEMLVEHPRLGYWNDCLGAIDDANMNPAEVLVVAGEVCSLPPRSDYSCATMTAYLKAIQLDLLHANFFRPTLDRWDKDGCLDEIRRKLGYRYVIREARLAADGSWMDIRIDNVGWGGSRLSRPLFLVADGRRIRMIADLANFLPGTVNRVHVQLDAPLYPSAILSLETDDHVQFSNQKGNLLYRPAPAVP